MPNERKPGSDRSVGPADKKLEKKVVKAVERRRNDFTRDLAQKCRTSATMPANQSKK